METFSWSSRSSLTYMFTFTMICLSSMIYTSEAQRTSDPDEVTVLNSIFTKWKISDKWNMSTGPCGLNNTDSMGFRILRIECNCPDKNRTCNIIGIFLKGMSINGKIPEELQNLPQLTNLSLSSNSLIGPLPSFIGNLTKLQELDLSSNSLSGNIPKELGNLQNLKDLSLSGNSLIGPLPSFIGNLTKLQELDLSSNSLSGNIPKEFGNLQNLKDLSLSGNSLIGPLPSFIGNLTKLEELDLSSNSLSGNIPKELGNLQNLKDLSLSGNSLIGPLPSFIGNITKLQELYLNRNALSGTIPKELGNLQNLKKLDLYSNSLSGTLPKELGNLQNLNYLDLRYNSLEEAIPNELESLRNLTNLYLSQNSLSGAIPKELGNLQNLNYLDLNQNLLSGDIPKKLGNLPDLYMLSLSNNSLSGTIPKELGNLRNLTNLDLSINSFIGSLPLSFGNLTNMEYLDIRSAGLSGEIPSTFINLKQMKGLWASYNNFTGKLPHFMGTWTNMETLWLHGNAFQGPIPSSFARLTSLWYLQIGELYTVTSTLEFIRNMTSLETLILRNCMITDSLTSLSSSIGNFSKLRHLDLSFNNISGSNVESLINLSSLQYLFLGNNNLFGVVPSMKASNLKVIDLSYNFFSGSLPSWATDNKTNLQLNMVANNFTEDDFNKSQKYTNLYCIQRDFPCNRGSPKYSSFAVNSGGPARKKENVEFDKDEKDLDAASFYVTASQRWAVSSVGVNPNNRGNSDTIIKSNSNQCDTRKSTISISSQCLLEDVRVSAGSIRYYGLGLNNGNYTVTLEFSILDSTNEIIRRSLQRRIFDIYIQGELKKNDFNVGNATVKMDLIQVTENFLEIHLFWAGKGLWDLYGPSIAAVSAMIESTPNRRNLGAIIGISVSCGLIIILAISIPLILRRNMSLNNDEELRGVTFRTQIFSYAELKRATDGFNPKNKLGEGGFGPVYKGVLSDGRAIAVKQLSLGSRQGKVQFLTEIDVISAVHHRNLVKLYGCCIEGSNRLLVYEYLENKSLDKALFEETDLDLSWKTRFDICVETGRGLAYLHEESRPKIVHRDVKASSILLDAKLKPKLSDFGLAKLYDDSITHISTKVVGTVGYLAPEYAMKGHLSEKADVFGFGVALLEILSGRPNFASNLSLERVYLLEWAWLLYETSRELEIIDPRLKVFNKEEANRVFTVGLLCTQLSPTLRPSMSRVVSMLLGDVELSTISSKPGYLNDSIMVVLEGSSSIFPSTTSITLSFDNRQTR